MDALDWGVETVTVPKNMVSTGLNPSREEVSVPVSIYDASVTHHRPVSEDSQDANNIEPKTLAEKFGLKAMLAKLGDADVEKSAKKISNDKTAQKKLKKCAPV